MYLMIGTRPDLVYAVGILSRYCNELRLAHWKAMKRVFCYVKKALEIEIKYEANEDELLCWSDSVYGADPDSKNSISGYTITYCKGPIMWRSTRQPTVATSTTA